MFVLYHSNDNYNSCDALQAATEDDVCVDGNEAKETGKRNAVHDTINSGELQQSALFYDRAGHIVAVLR